MKTIKNSKQRERILQAVREHPVHPTADEVYSWLKTEYPSLSLGTVYRNLSLLSELGKLRKLSIPAASDRYDGNLEAHYHLLCEECGRVFDVFIPPLASLNQMAAEETGCAVSGHEILFRGLCKNCGACQNAKSPAQSPKSS